MWLLYRSTELKSSCKHHFLTTVSFCCLNCGFVCCLLRYWEENAVNYSLVLQRQTGQTAVLQAPALDHMRSNDCSTTEIFVDNFVLSTLSILSTRDERVQHYLYLYLYLLTIWIICICICTRTGRGLTRKWAGFNLEVGRVVLKWAGL